MSSAQTQPSATDYPIRDTLVEEPSTWLAHELDVNSAWRYRLSPKEVNELDAATRQVTSAGLEVGVFTREDFPLPTLGPRIEAMVDNVENGCGVSLVQGVPISRYDEATLKLLYWGFGVHSGNVISQNSKGQLLAEVRDHGNEYSNPDTRGFSTNAELLPHVDTSDMTTLLCVRTARSGGRSRVVSSTAVYNTILHEHPEYLEVLYRGFYNDLRGEGPTGSIDEVTRNRIPVFSYHAGRVSCSFNYRMIEGGALRRKIPLGEHERAALDFLREVSLRSDHGYWFTMAPGDIQMVSNHSVFHSRSNFVDHQAQQRRRCLYRLWVNIRGGRELAPSFADRYNTGPRGGVAVGDGARYKFS